MRIAVSGAGGFIGQNLCVRLREAGFDIQRISHDTDDTSLRNSVQDVEFVFHLAGVNRPDTPSEFETGNKGFSTRLAEALSQLSPPPRVLYSSSAQAEQESAYGLSKRAAEECLKRYAETSHVAVYLCRLPNVFGKWSRPDYNSVIATFCHRLARGLPIIVHDSGAPLILVHIDTVVDKFIGLLNIAGDTWRYVDVGPVYETTVGEVAEILQTFAEQRTKLAIDHVGSGLRRALYATFISFLPPNEFSYEISRYRDSRGEFVEMLKTPDCGQFSYFTAHPGVTRGEHYHHTKTEKFLVIRGRARFAFRNIQSQDTYAIDVSSEVPTIVESIPGWAHNVKNVGTDELIVMLWANEVYDRLKPDTIGKPV